MKNFLHSPKIKAIIIIVAGAIVLLVVFAFGASIGYHRGLFADRFGENYFRNFYGVPGGKMTLTLHGVAGNVLNVSSATIAVEAADGDEQSVLVGSGTVIREENNTVMVQNVGIGDEVTVIGSPTGQGQIEARFIRVFPTTSSFPAFVEGIPWPVPLPQVRVIAPAPTPATLQP